MSKKLTLEFIKQRTKEITKGYKCVADIYINCMTKILFICDKNHEFFMTWNNFKNRKRCSECFGSKKHTIEYIKQKTKEIRTRYQNLAKEIIQNMQ